MTPLYIYENIDRANNARTLNAPVRTNAHTHTHTHTPNGCLIRKHKRSGRVSNGGDTLCCATRVDFTADLFPCVRVCAFDCVCWTALWRQLTVFSWRPISVKRRRRRQTAATGCNNHFIIGYIG